MIKYYLHKPTGWTYHTDPDCPIYLVPLNSEGVKIPASLAVFGNQKDWVEYVPEPSLRINIEGQLIWEMK